MTPNLQITYSNTVGNNLLRLFWENLLLLEWDKGRRARMEAPEWYSESCAIKDGIALCDSHCS